MWWPMTKEQLQAGLTYTEQIVSLKEELRHCHRELDKYHVLKVHFEEKMQESIKLYVN